MNKLSCLLLTFFYLNFFKFSELSEFLSQISWARVFSVNPTPRRNFNRGFVPFEHCARIQQPARYTVKGSRGEVSFDQQKDKYASQLSCDASPEVYS
jgi:hypothetical protein